MRNQTSRITARQSYRAFTLVEVLIATILVGLSIAALVAANGTLTMANGAGTDQSTAEFLAEQIRELTTMLPVVDPQMGAVTFGPEEPNLPNWDDVDDFDGASFSPPIGANRTALTTFASFRQQVTVQSVDRANFNLVVADHTSDFVRVTVTILRNGQRITSASWIRAKY